MERISESACVLLRLQGLRTMEMGRGVLTASGLFKSYVPSHVVTYWQTRYFDHLLATLMGSSFRFVKSKHWTCKAMLPVIKAIGFPNIEHQHFRNVQHQHLSLSSHLVPQKFLHPRVVLRLSFVK